MIRKTKFLVFWTNIKNSTKEETKNIATSQLQPCSAIKTQFSFDEMNYSKITKAEVLSFLVHFVHFELLQFEPFSELEKSLPLLIIHRKLDITV